MSWDSTWATPPESGAPPSPSIPVVVTRMVSPAQAADLAWLGRCVARPFRRDGKGDFANLSGVALVAAAVAQVLGTLCTTGRTFGELPWRPEFGNGLELLRHRNVDDAFVPLAQVYVRDALQRWEPRAVVKSTSIDKVLGEAGEYEVHLRVEYDVQATKTPGSAVVARGIVADVRL